MSASFYAPDLHIHSTASDGAYAPRRLVRLAKDAGIDFLSLTDHDTLDGLEAAEKACKELGIGFLPGVEISATGEAEVHVLGYGVSPENEQLQTFLQDMKRERIRRFEQMNALLIEQGIHLPAQEILDQAGASIGRGHLARALLQHGSVNTIQEAFDKYLGPGCLAYVPRIKRTVVSVLQLLREMNAVPVIAHPMLLHWEMDELASVLDSWQEAGLMGLEVYHPGNWGCYDELEQMARSRGLLVTGGSDFHDDRGHHGILGEMLPEWVTARADTEKLLEAIY